MAEIPARKKPNSLNNWQQHLLKLALPVNPVIKAAALQKLHARTGNANNIAQILKNDPALSLLLMHEANKSLSKSGNETHSLSHTLSLLGFPRVETLIRRAPDYDPDNFPQLHEFKQQLSISLHAAHQAAALAALNPHWQQQDIFWATLFYRAPIWMLWYQAGHQMMQLQQIRANHNGASHSLAEQRLLGTTVQALAALLSRRWHLPQLSQQAWQPGLRGKARHWIMLSRMIPEKSHVAMEQFPRLQQISSRPAFLIALSNRLADETEWDWYSQRTLRVQKIIAATLNRSVADTIALSHQQAVSATHQQGIPDTLPPAQQLFSFYRKAELLKSAVHKSIPTDNTTQKVATIKKNTALRTKEPHGFTAIIERLEKQADSFNNLHQVMDLAVNTLCQQLKLERASACLLDAHNKTLRTYYSSGAEDSPTLKSFRHTIKRGDLFNKLLQKPLSVRLQASNYSQLWPLLPGNFKQACGADEFFMMSVFSNKKPVAIVYGDCGNTNSSLSDQQYTLFKRLCTAVSQCLQTLA